MKIIAAAALAMAILNGFAGNAQVNIPAPRVIVYKTRGDYAHMVPVTLSDDRSRIISYPAIDDVRNTFPQPTKLARGYLLDNGGRINRHVAFLKLSFEEYGKLDMVPPLPELYQMLADKKPLTALYDCGQKGINSSEKHLKRLIRKRRLKDACKEIN